MLMKKKFNMLMHIHNCNEIYYLIDGHANYLIDGKKYEVIPGGFVFIPTEVPHKTFTFEGDFMERYVINFKDLAIDDDVIKVLKEVVFKKSPVLIVPQKKRLQVESIFMKIENEYKKNDKFSELIKKCYLQELIVLMIRLCEDDDVFYHETKETNDANKLCEYFEKNYSFDLSLEKVADYMGYSNAYMSRYMKKILGTTFSAYLNSLRMKHALEYLKESDYNVSEIAARCGFSSSNYFAKIFKSQMNITPHDFKKQYRLRKE